MRRLFFAFLILNIGYRAMADCVPQLDMAVDTQKTAQRKTDCLIQENAALRAEITRLKAPPHVQFGSFPVRDALDLQKARLGAFSWITAHNGTQVSNPDEPIIHAHVGDFIMGLFCFPDNGRCVFFAAGPNEQELKDAANAISH
jgi:hypothetical protein